MDLADIDLGDPGVRHIPVAFTPSAPIGR